MKRTKRNRTMRANRNQRTGGAAAEAAITLPFFIVIIAATIELSTAIYLKESLTIAAYEGARVAVTRKADDDSVVTRIENIMAGRGINYNGEEIGDNVRITPACDKADILEPITITITAPVTGNCIAPFRWMQFVTPPKLSATVVMRKEFKIEPE